jgi:hypothetical protein
MSLANLLFALVLVSAFATLVVLMVGIVAMGVPGNDDLAAKHRGVRLMAWRVRLQLLTVALLPLWYLASHR